MATTNRVYILLAFVLSSIAAIFNIVSLSTEEWVKGQAIWTNMTGDVNYVNYGLFQGNYKRSSPFVSIFQLTMTCSFGNNVCALLCGRNSEDREDLLENLYNNNIDPAYSMDNCPVVSKYYHTYTSFENVPISENSNSYVSSDSFINAGVWLCTLILVILAALVGFAAAVLALYNTVTNPIQYYLSVKSLFVYNAIAFGSTALYMALWGTMYIIIIFHNLSIYDTIVGTINSDKTAYLGYSYWISFIPLAFYAGSIGSLYYREYLNERDPKQKNLNIDSDANDPNLYLY